MSKEHDIVAVLPMGEGPVNEYDSIIVERDREFEELIRLGSAEQIDDHILDQAGATTDQICGQLAPLTGFAVASSTRMQQRRADITFRPATDDDCIALASTMRLADRDEVASFSGRSPLEALRSSLSVSTHAVAAVDREGRIICMFGVGSVGFMSDCGCPWLLGSDLIDVHWRLFVRLSRRYLAAMLNEYDWLSGLVSKRHDQSIRYLRWLGFYVGRHPTFINGHEFLAYNLRR